jgi:hypothetical protein
MQPTTLTVPLGGIAARAVPRWMLANWLPPFKRERLSKETGIYWHRPSCHPPRVFLINIALMAMKLMQIIMHSLNIFA